MQKIVIVTKWDLGKSILFTHLLLTTYIVLCQMRAPEIWTGAQSVSYKSERDFFFFPYKVPTHLHRHRDLGHQGIASWSQKWEYCQTRKLLPWSQGKSGEEAYVSFHKSSYSPLPKSILLFSLFINKHPPTPLFFIFYPKDHWIILIVTLPTILTVFIWHEARIFQGTVIRKKHKKNAHTRDRIFQYPESQQSFKTGFVKRKKRNRFSKFFHLPQLTYAKNCLVTTHNRD